MRLFGSLQSRMMESAAQPDPVVGMGATICMWSDRHAVSVIAVSPSGRRVTVQRDKVTRTDSHGMSDSQAWSYERNAQGLQERFSLRQNGRWVRVGESAATGTSLTLGFRDEHYDFGF